MASTSGGAGGGGVPAERVAAAVNDLLEVRDGLARLKISLEDQEPSLSSPPPWTEQMDGMMNKLTTALSMLDIGALPSAAGSGERVIRQQTAESSGGRAKKRSFSRRSQRPSRKIVTATLVDDGHVWRKYGQKEIQNSPYPRSYYRCTHKADQGCKAKRHVQLSETEPIMHVVTYYGEHTCRDPASTMNPTIIHTAGAPSDDGGANNLISFAPASYGSFGAAAASQLAMEGNTSQSWCTTSADEVFSSSTELPFVQWDELAAAVVGSAGMAPSTVDSAPKENGGLGDITGGGGGGGGSFLSSPSPSSLGFVVGPLGGIGGDNESFPFDP